MANYKVTYFFERVQAGGALSPSTAYGWTETLYTRVPQNLEQALLFAKGSSFLTVRANMLENGASITYVRVSEVGARAVKLAYVGIPGNAGAGAAQTTCAVLILFTAAPSVTPLDARSRRRAYLLRGMPATFINGDQLTILGRAATVAFANYILTGPDVGFGLVNLSPWGVAYVDESIPWRNLTNAKVLASDRRSLLATMFAPLALAVGTRIQTRRIDQPRGANRIWTVSTQSPDNTVVTIGKARRLLDSGDWPTATGEFRNYLISIRPFSNFLVGGLRAKKTGRPFRLPVGRSRGAK